MDFLYRTPFVRLLFALIIGILIYQYIELYTFTRYAIYLIATFLIISPFFIQDAKNQFRFRWLFGVGTFLFFAMLGYSLSAQREKSTSFSPLNKKGIYLVELTSAPTEKAKSFFYSARVKQFLNDDRWETARGKAYLYLQKDSAASSLIVGDQLLIETEFKAPEKALNPDEFDYAAYLKRQGVGATAYVPTGYWEKAGENHSFSLIRFSDQCRNYLFKIYQKFNIHGDEFSVLAALTLGYKDDLNPDLKKSYSASGAMHILSVSGLHVGTVYAVLLFLFGFLQNKKPQKLLKSILLILSLWGYAFITGLSPSVVRATSMFTFVAVATCLDRKSEIYNTICMSAFFMLLVNPNYLFDIGFQLSYAAVFSIIYFQPYFTIFIPVSNKILKSLRDLLTVSVAAQIGTAPFTLYYFQQFPNYFLFTNLIVIPLSTIIIYLAVGLFAISFVPYVSNLVAFLLNISVKLLNFCIVKIEHLPYSISQVSLDSKQSFFIILFIFCISAYFYYKKYTPLIMGLLSILFIISIDFYARYQTLNTRRMIVYAGQRNTHVNFIDQGNNFLFSTDEKEAERVATSYWRKHKLKPPIEVQNTSWFTNGFACFQGQHIFILINDELKNKIAQKPLEVDYLIIGNGQKIRMEQLLSCIHPRKVIVDKTISKWYADNIQQTCEKQKIEFYSIANEGAFILNF
ncbi:MAG: ComEC/Rec2 family competence protein [Paludibacteraceae bacterium]|nr:ComEC/Rec2 family competence protein [Paludibacteraceae bacterium]